MENEKLLELEWELSDDYTYGKSFTYNYPGEEFYILNDNNGIFILNFWKFNEEYGVYSIDMLLRSKDLDKILIEHEKHLNKNDKRTT